LTACSSSSTTPENKNFVDPLYGKTYLPRKFKIAFVIPPVNDLDVFTNCLGFIAIVENDQLVGYNLAVGGGMGRSHGNEADLSAPRGCHRLFHAGQSSWTWRKPC
jgi:sulfite reductase beta subunit-like hemoprotein